MEALSMFFDIDVVLALLDMVVAMLPNLKEVGDILLTNPYK
jgi:hypothetical protein